jgi:prolyl-tRNA synthetase
MARTAIQPTRLANFPHWYQSLITAADLAENSIVRGCMVIKPWGMALWELLQKDLDKRLKDSGHQNFYFPLFIPLSLLGQEANHIDGFAKECAVITHHRLVMNENKELIPAGKLEEPLVVRPTSEALIGEAYSRWIQSYRDLPLLGNQWANVVRWEMRPRIFLRSSEFLWQEGHTAHATKAEALEESTFILELYRVFIEEILAIPVITGQKTRNEAFPGADLTYSLEAMMQDGKALQAGTSHFLGQHFSKAFNICFSNKQGEQEYTWTTSWGISTRLIGGLIMTHGDDNGCVLPPRIAPWHVIIIPVFHKSTDSQAILNSCYELKEACAALHYGAEAIRVSVDNSDKRAGDKQWAWVKKGVPIRIEIGPQEYQNNTVSYRLRSEEPLEKHLCSRDEFLQQLPVYLETMQTHYFQKAQNLREENTREVHSKEEFYQVFSQDAKQPAIHPFVLAYWCEDDESEKAMKSDLQVTARCIPSNSQEKRGICIFSGKKDARLTLFARSY